jgi:hypothetical protein
MEARDWRGGVHAAFLRGLQLFLLSHIRTFTVLIRSRLRFLDEIINASTCQPAKMVVAKCSWRLAVSMHQDFGRGKSQLRSSEVL